MKMIKPQTISALLLTMALSAAFAGDVLPDGTNAQEKKEPDLADKVNAIQPTLPPQVNQHLNGADSLAAPDNSATSQANPNPPPIPQPTPQPVAEPMTQPTALPAQSSPPATSGAGTVRDIKKETIPLKGKSFNSVKKLPNIEIAPGSIKKIFVVVAAPNVSQKVLLKALQLIKAQISIKILVVQNKSSSEIGKHVNATGKLTFDSFSDAVRLNFPFKDDQRMVYLVDGEIVRHEGNSPSLYLSNPPQGVAAISLTSLSLGHEDSYIQLAKVLKALAARFYYITSNCGVLSEAATYEGTQKLPEDFCPEDKENMKSMKMIP